MIRKRPRPVEFKERNGGYRLAYGEVTPIGESAVYEDDTNE